MTPEQASEASERLEKTITDGGQFTAADFPPHVRGDGKRFHVRILGNGWQVYGLGLIHVCLCDDGRMANMVAKALEAAASPTVRGVPIGINDRDGKPIHIGDTLRLDQREFGRQMEFVIELCDGQIQYPGATGDLSSWCEIVKPWDGEGTPA